MQRLNSLSLIVILLGFSYVISVASAIPATRTQNLKVEDTSALPSLALLENGGEMMVDVEEGLMERRTDLEIQDYPGTGPDKDHNPKPPGLV